MQIVGITEIKGIMHPNPQRELSSPRMYLVNPADQGDQEVQEDHSGLN